MNDSPADGKELLLFVADDEPPNRVLYQQVASICNELPTRRDLPVTLVDVRKRPDIARRYHVFVTPMLLARNSTTERRIVGDLSDREHLLAGLKA